MAKLTEAQERTRMNLRVLRERRWVALNELEAIRRDVRDALKDKQAADTYASRAALASGERDR